MDIVQLLQNLAAQITELQAKFAEAQNKLADVQALLDSEKLASFNEGKSVGYEEGFAAGQAASGNGKLYSQEEADALVANAVAPLQEQINVLQGQVDAMPQKIADAVAIAKAELKAQVEALIDAQQSAESSSEAELKQNVSNLFN